ncbi:MAG: ABC transporter permease [Sphaerochaeta sp.]|nr:ABC transporter permease [Sphaerochaeta sp.]
MNKTRTHEKMSIHEFLRRYSVLISAVVMLVISTSVTKGVFLSANNILNIGERAAAIGIVALGQMLVILTGGLDLSVSGIIAVGYCVSSLLLEHTMIPVPLVIVLMLLATTLCGALNGFFVSKTRVSPFMLTLGTSMIFQSFAFVLSKGATLIFTRQIDWMKSAWGIEGVLSRVFPTFIWLLTSLVVIFILAYTRLGKNIFLTGGKELASKMSGVKTGNIKFFVYTASGFLSGLTALTIEFRVNMLNVSSTEAFQIASIAAVVIGGTSLKGGEGNVYGTLIGAFIMASIVNVMNLTGINVYSQNIVKGVVLLTFVTISFLLSNKSKQGYID